MGFYVCSIHGENETIALCEHAAAQLSRGALESTHATPIMEVCSACMQAHPEVAQLEGLSVVHLAFDPLLAPAFDVLWPLHTKGHCAMCVDAARIHGARTRGEPDPFVVYERSLWPIDRKLVSELRASLLSRFTFPNSTLATMLGAREPALNVLEGSFRNPVLIEVHGILDVTTQDAITALVKTFFEGLTRNQAKLTFFEAMVVQELVGKDGKRFPMPRLDQTRVLRVEVFGATPS